MLSQRKLSSKSRHLKQANNSKKLLLSPSPSHRSPKLTFPSPRPKLIRPQHPREQLPPTVLHIPNPGIKQQLVTYPLKSGIVFLDETAQPDKKDFIVVSKIDQFATQYSQYYNKIYAYAQSVHWIIISRAVNNSQVEKDFNIKYQPIVFHFRKTMAAAINLINFGIKDIIPVTIDWFSRIINFQAFQNQFPVIVQCNKQQIGFKRPNKNELWLIQECSISDLQKETGFNYCFIDQFSINDYKLQITTSKTGLIYILVGSKDKILNVVNPTFLSSTFDENLIKSNLLLSTNYRYCQKLSNSFLANETLYCLIGFPQKLVTIFSKHFDYIILSLKTIKIPNIQIFCIYYSSKDISDVFGVQFNKTNKEASQIYRIKVHYEAILRLKQLYSLQYAKNNKINIALFHLSQRDQLQGQIQQFIHTKIQVIEQINSLFKLYKKIILVGSFSKLQKSSLSKVVQITLVDINQCKNDLKIIHQQIILALQKLNNNKQSVSMSPRVISFNLIMQEFKEEKAYLCKPINQFRQVISRVEEYCHHIILMEMDDYTQQRQHKITQTQTLREVTFQIYLRYGSEFISRTKQSKYNFLKRDQIIIKIRQICQQFNQQYKNCQDQLAEFIGYDQKMYSDVFASNNSINRIRYLSTPHLYNSQRQIFIIVPKTIPHHSLAYRSAQSYSLLVYSHIQQVRYFSRHIKDHFAAVIVEQIEMSKNLQIMGSEFIEYISVCELSESIVRQQIDKIVEKLGLVKKNGGILKPQRGQPTLILFDCQDPKQIKLITQMKSIFKNSRIITMSKKQFKELRANFSIHQNLIIHEMGIPQLTHAKRVRNILDLFKIYMSPSHSSLQFTSQYIRFSSRQLFIKQYYERSKKDRLRGRLHDINMNKAHSVSLRRMQSPNSKSFKNIECFVSEAGMTILESISISKIPKSQKFTHRKHFISLAFSQLNKGNIILTVLSQGQYKGYQQNMNCNVEGIVWIVVTQRRNYCIIRQSNIVYCLKDQLQNILIQISAKFRTFRTKQFYIQNIPHSKFLQQQDKIQVRVYQRWLDCPKKPDPGQDSDSLNLITEDNIKQLSTQQLGSALVCKNGQRLQSILNHLSKIKQNPKDMQQQLIQIDPQVVHIMLHLRNRQFIIQCLRVIGEERYMIFTFQSVENIIHYSQISKIIVVLEKEDQMELVGSVCVQGSDTPESFSNKLQTYIQAVRKSN